MFRPTSVERRESPVSFVGRSSAISSRLGADEADTTRRDHGFIGVHSEIHGQAAVGEREAEGPHEKLVDSEPENAPFRKNKRKKKDE